MSETGKPAMIQGAAIVGRRDLREDREYEVKSYNFFRPDKFAAHRFFWLHLNQRLVADLRRCTLSECGRRIGDGGENY